MKKFVTLCLALTLFLSSIAPSVAVFAESTAPSTGHQARFSTILETPNPKSKETPRKGILPSTGGTVKFRYDSKDVLADNMTHAVYKDGVKIDDFKFASTVAHDGQAMNGVEYTVTLPANTTAKDVVYHFYVKEKADAAYDAEKNLITITVKKYDPSSAEITGGSETDITLPHDAKGRFIFFSLYGQNLEQNNVSITTEKITQHAPDIQWRFTKSQDGLMAVVKTVPTPPENGNYVYKTTFSTESGTTHKVIVTIQGKDATPTAPTGEKTLDAVTFEPSELPKGGGEVIIHLKGNNIADSDIKPEIQIRGADQQIPITWAKTSDGLDGKMTLPANDTSKKITYACAFYLKNDPSKFVKGRVYVTTEDGAVKPTLTSMTASPTTLASSGGSITLTAIAKNATASDIEFIVEKDDVKDSSLVPSATPSVGSHLSFALTLPENTTEKAVIYTIKARAKGEADYKSVQVTVEKKAAAPAPKTSKIITMGDQDKVFDDNGGTHRFNVIATPNVSKDKIRLQIKKNGDVVTVPYTVTGDKARKGIEITFPKNTDTADANYTIAFNATGSDANFQDEPIVKVTIKAPLVIQGSVDSLQVTNDQLPLKGGQTTLTANGKNLDSHQPALEIYRLESGAEEKLDSKDYVTTPFAGRAEVQSATLAFPKVEKDTTFVLKVASNDGKIQTAYIYQTKEGSNKETQVVTPRQTFSLGEHTLILDFNELISEARVNSILKGIRLNDGVNTIAISEADNITVTDHMVRIDFKDAIFTADKNYTVQVDARTLDVAAGQNKSFTSVVKKDSPYVEKTEFIEGYQLAATGGKATFKLSGYNLPEDIQFKIQENNEKKTPLNVVPTVQGDEHERTISFDVPPNTTDKVKTYTIMYSFDGVLYTSDASTSGKRFRKLVVSVLPQNATAEDAKKPQIDFMQIQSYGTSLTGDVTHTNLPTGQESKKTLVWIYGANLNADHTRLRLKDKNGVYWSPIYDAVHDSGDRILMVMLDGMHGGTPGMTGKGNNMLMEVILPRGYVPDNWDGFHEGITFKYEVAPDGVNFNEKTTVTATVDYDGEPPKQSLDDKLIDVVVRHVDKDGKDIVPKETVKAYKHLPPNVFQKLLPLRDEKGFIPGFEGYQVKDTDELVFGKKRSGISFDANAHGKEYYGDKNLPELMNAKGEIVLVYDKQEATKPNIKPGSKKEDGGYIAVVPIGSVSKTSTNTPKTPDIAKATQGYIKGYPDHTFRPNKEMTRAEAATILANLLKLPVDSSAKSFGDVDGWYNGAIRAVIDKGLMKGYKNGHFKPEAPITRAEFVTLLMPFLKEADSSSALKDISEHWAKDAITRAEAQGWIHGYPDGNFRPDATITRAEVVAIVNRAFHIKAAEKATLHFSDVDQSHWAYKDIIAATY